MKEGLETLPLAPLSPRKLMLKLKAVLMSVRVVMRGERALAVVGGREVGGVGRGGERGKLKPPSYSDVLRMKTSMKAYSLVCMCCVCPCVCLCVCEKLDQHILLSRQKSSSHGQNLMVNTKIDWLHNVLML